MEPIYFFLGKSSLVLAIFFCCYKAFLERETFYGFNRFFLMAGLLGSLLLPMLIFTHTVYVPAVANPILEVSQTAVTLPYDPLPVATTVPAKPSFTVWQLFFYAYALGVLFFLVRFGLSLYRILRFCALPGNTGEHRFFKKDGLRYLEFIGLPAPFSFFNTIVYDPAASTDAELKLILAHERQHARQLHSVDLLLGRLLCAVFWFNPLMWFYARAIERNLEFLADYQVNRAGLYKKAYQLALVHISSGKTPALTQSFYQSFIKKRIIMLNKNHSSPIKKFRILFMLPLLALFIYGFNVREEIKVKQKTKTIINVGAQKDTLVFSNSSTPEEIRALEKYFSANPNIKIDVKSRNNAG